MTRHIALSSSKWWAVSTRAVEGKDGGFDNNTSHLPVSAPETGSRSLGMFEWSGTVFIRTGTRLLGQERSEE